MSAATSQAHLKILKTRSCLWKQISYKTQTEIVTFQGREIPLENLTPILTPEQEAANRRELEQRLYEVFRKYQQKPTLFFFR